MGRHPQSQNSGLVVATTALKCLVQLQAGPISEATSRVVYTTTAEQLPTYFFPTDRHTGRFTLFPFGNTDNISEAGFAAVMTWNNWIFSMLSVHWTYINELQQKCIFWAQGTDASIWYCLSLFLETELLPEMLYLLPKQNNVKYLIINVHHRYLGLSAFSFAKGKNKLDCLEIQYCSSNHFLAFKMSPLCSRLKWNVQFWSRVCYILTGGYSTAVWMS